MNLEKFKEEKYSKTLKSMDEYLSENPECGYSKEDITKCGQIIDNYIESLNKNNSISEEYIISCIKEIVIKLNELNIETDYCLIETDQREDLCDFILNVAKYVGLKDDNDVTEEWREW